MLKQIKKKLLEIYLYKLPIYQICFEFDVLKKVKPNFISFFSKLCEEGSIEIDRKGKFFMQNKKLYFDNFEELIEITNLKELEEFLEEELNLKL